MEHPQIIGLAGSFGSGCTYIAREILTPAGYTFFSLSDSLKKLFLEENPKYKAIEGVPRAELQSFGDRIRKEKGVSFFAEQTWNEINKEFGKDRNKRFVVDSIRNPAEISFFRKNTIRFFLFGIYSDRNIRWNRVKGKYKNDEGAFDADDKNDTGDSNPQYGQHVGHCFYESDIVFINNSDYSAVGNKKFNDFDFKIKQYVELVSNPLRRQAPQREEEAIMSMAYAISQRSSCMKRKVGAIIVDDFGNAISSGYNEVPKSETPCEKEHNECYRKKVRTDFYGKIESCLPPEKKLQIQAIFEEHFKILDCCRALHAEENAIVNLARNGRSIPLDKCTLYTTTYPCRMCANKIVQAGIKKVVYFEPYPDPVAKVILANESVQDVPFEGVTFKAYFRLYGEEK
jgi:deoxycytidylate deaminase/dephospho-CoA kinase